MPVLTRSKEALEQIFKTPQPPSSVEQHTALLPTPTSLSPASEKRARRGKRLRLSAEISHTVSRSMSVSSGDSWSGRSSVPATQKQLPPLRPDPDQVRRFLDTKKLCFQPTPQLEYLVDLEKRNSVCFRDLRFTTYTPVTNDHYQLLLDMVLVCSPNDAPSNTAFTAYALLARYLSDTGSKRVSGRALQEALLCACCLIAFKLVEEIDMELNLVIKRLHLSCSYRQIVHAERKVCAGLGWRLHGPPTPDEAVHAVLDSLDIDMKLDYASKAMLAHCCAQVTVECLLENSCAGVISAAAAALMALFSTLCPKLDAHDVSFSLRTHYSIDMPEASFEAMLAKFKSFQK